MLGEGITRFAAAIKNNIFDDIGTVEALMTTANAKLAALKTKLIEKFNRLRKNE